MYQSLLLQDRLVLKCCVLCELQFYSELNNEAAKTDSLYLLSADAGKFTNQIFSERLVQIGRNLWQIHIAVLCGEL